MGEVIISGYACVVETKSIIPVGEGIKRHRELIKARAFDDSLRKNWDVPLTYQGRVLVNGSQLSIYENNIGLGYQAVISDDVVISKILNGEIIGCNPRYEVLAHHSQLMSMEIVRVVKELRLLEIYLVDSNPVFRSTVEVRKGSHYMRTYIKNGLASAQMRADRLSRSLASAQMRLDRLKSRE